MEPELREGDVALALTWRRLWRLTPGAMVLFRRSDIGLMVKKVERILPDGGLFVVGTVPTSVDSYEFGPVLPDEVVGVVIWVFR